MENQITLHLPVKIEHEGKVFIYDPSQITIDRANCAEAIVSFRAEQMQKGVDQFTKLQFSGSLEWLEKAAACLLIEENKKDFNISVWDASAAFVKTLPYTYRKTLDEILNHFFLSIGKSWMLSLVLMKDQSNARNQLSLERILQMIATRNNANS